jgi:hypothetical protein
MIYSKMTTAKYILCFFFWLPTILVAQETTKQRALDVSKFGMIVWDPQRLAVTKAKIAAKDATVLPAYEHLLLTANEALQFKTVSVMEKKDIPPSGDKHDYMSIAPYWWPDPAQPTGAPYIRKDGEVNPEVHNFQDKENLPRLCEHVYNLSLAYYFSGKEVYAKHASALIKVWFLDAATAMNPNLEFGQAIKGVSAGRGAGLIDIRHFVFLVESVGLLNASEHFKVDEQQKLKKWMTQFLFWMNNSAIGKDEQAAGNNHGVWYDATSLALANFIGDTTLAQQIIQRAAKRLTTQMNAEGYFPLELARTTSMHYSTFVLEAFVCIASMAEKNGVDFWNLQPTAGKSLKKGIETLLQHIDGNKAWTWQQIKPYSYTDAYSLLWTASLKYNCSTCMSAIKKNATNFQKMQLHLF